MNLSRNNLEPGTAIESQAKGHPVTGTEEAGRASQGSTPATRSERGLTNPTGCPPLSHGIIIRRFTSAEIRAALRRAGERDRPYFREGGRLW